MRLLIFDIESNGPDPQTCSVAELGWVIREIGTLKPLVVKSHHLIGLTTFDEGATRVNHITLEFLEKCGIPRDEVSHDFKADVERYKPDYIVAHNWHRFDGPLLKRFLTYNGVLCVELPPAIDTLEDLPEESYENVYRNRTLVDMCTDRQFLNPFPHTALADSLALDKLLSFEDIDKVIARSKVPSVTVFADVSFQDKDLAKERGYYWQNLRGVIYNKKWVKRLKQDKVDEEQANCPFNVGIIE